MAQTRTSYTLSFWLFRKAIAVIYLLAFWGLYSQMEGLYGVRGILPIQDYIAGLTRHFGGIAVFKLPTLFWFFQSNLALKVLCGVGVIAALLAVIGVLPGLCFLVIWVLYLSLVNVGQAFLSFQWDILLLEVGFLCLFMSPWVLWEKGPRREPIIGLRFLVYWLLFRLMLGSGIVKLLSGDPQWRGLTALTFHYLTQPLPHIGGWLAHQLPVWAQKASVVMMFVIECILPFFIWGPKRFKQIAFIGLISLQMLILMTGNYGFFNLITLTLCIPLLPDAIWEKWGSKWTILRERPKPAYHPLYLVPVTALILTLSGTFELKRLGVPVPQPIQALTNVTYPYHIVGRYGLFAVMTTVRNEIDVQGSRDGRNWQSYVFKFKPGALDRPPIWVQPFHPRLDWQMWFAALNHYSNQRWYLAFLSRCLEGSPDVLGLLQSNPFNESPPKYIRGVFDTYTYTTVGQLWETGEWWQKEPQGLYSPVMSFQKQ